MDHDAIRAFAKRDREPIEASRRQHWRDLLGAGPSRESLVLADALRADIARRNPGWPDADSRAADLTAHLALIALIDRVDRHTRRA